MTVKYHTTYNYLQVVTTGLALKLYLIDNGSLPDDITSLVPTYLSKVSQDTYNDFMPLQCKFKGTGFTVYNFGLDRKDGGGMNPYGLVGPNVHQAVEGEDILFRYPSQPH